MVDFILLLVEFILTMGMTLLSFRTNHRFLTTLVAGVLWLVLAYMVMDLNLIMGLCCVGMGLYLWARTFVS